MQRFIRRFIGFPLIILAACGTMPSVPDYPSVAAPTYGNEAEELSSAEARYTINGVKLSDYTGGQLFLEKSYAGVLAQVRAHRVLWQHDAEELDKAVDKNGNVQFGAAALGGLGVLLGSLDVGKVGAGVAGGGSVYASHYQLSVQADNYRRAADAMQCIYKNVAALPESFWKAMYKPDGQMQFEKGFYVEPHDDKARTFTAQAAANPASAASAAVGAGREQSAAEAAAQGYDTLAGLWISVHDAILEVRKRLAASQRATRLAAPSSGEIATALQQKSDSKGSASNQGGSMVTSHGENRQAPPSNLFNKQLNDSPAAAQSLPSAQVLAQAIQLPKDLGTCVALIGSAQ